jgi:hypothetical protein
MAQYFFMQQSRINLAQLPRSNFRHSRGSRGTRPAHMVNHIQTEFVEGFINQMNHKIQFRLNGYQRLTTALQCIQMVRKRGGVVIKRAIVNLVIGHSWVFIQMSMPLRVTLHSAAPLSQLQRQLVSPGSHNRRCLIRPALPFTLGVIGQCLHFQLKR